MILSLSGQAVLFFSTVCIGALLGFLYDVFFMLRKAWKHPNLIIQLEDAVYWVLVMFTMFFFMLHKNYGEIRFFSILGAFLGMVLYFLTVSRLVRMVSTAIINGVKYILLLFFRILLTPFYLVYLCIREPVRKGRIFLKKRRQKALQLCKVCVKIKKRNLARQIKIMQNKPFKLSKEGKQNGQRQKKKTRKEKKIKNQ